MSNALVVFLTLAGFLAVAGLFVYLAVRSGAGWRKKMDAVLLPIGFTACQATGEKASIGQRLQIVNVRHAGKRLLMGLYRRASPQRDYDVYVCDYRFGSASGRGWGGGWVLVCLVSKSLQLPRFSIESVPEQGGMAGRLFNAVSTSFELPGLTRIESASLGLDARFRVYVDRAQVERVQSFKPHFAPALRDKGGVCIDAQGDTLVLSSVPMIADQVRQIFDSHKLLALVHLASSLYQQLREPAVVSEAFRNS